MSCVQAIIEMREKVHCELMHDEVARCVATSEMREQVHWELMRDEVVRCASTSTGIGKWSTSKHQHQK